MSSGAALPANGGSDEAASQASGVVLATAVAPDRQHAIVLLHINASANGYQAVVAPSAQQSHPKFVSARVKIAELVFGD